MRRLRPGWLFILVGLAFVGLFAAFLLHPKFELANQKNVRRLPPVVSASVPDFDLPLLGGGSQSFKGLKGKPVLLNFWATWCQPCKAEMPLLQRYALNYQDRLIVLGVDYQEESQTVKNFVDQVGTTYPIVLDQKGLVSELYYTRNFPTSFFIDTNGVLRAQHLGPLTEDLLVRYLKTIGIEP